MKFPMDGYKFVQTKDNNVIAISTFAGKTVKGVAKLSPEDEFDYAKGANLAAARCNQKIAKKRLARASRKFKEAAAEADKAYAWYDKMKQYYFDASDALDDANEALNKLKY